MNSRRVRQENLNSHNKYGETNKQTRYNLRSSSTGNNKDTARSSITGNKSCVVPHKQKQLGLVMALTRNTDLGKVWPETIEISSGRSEQRKQTHPKNNHKQTSNIGDEQASNLKNRASSSKNRIQKDLASNEVWVEKKKIQPTASLTESPTELEEEYYEDKYYEDDGSIYHIVWEGFCKEHEHLEQICPLCENDLSYTTAQEYDNDYYDDVQPSKLPDVAVLPCGHAFHNDCLMSYTEEDQLNDPPCLICISFLD